MNSVNTGCKFVDHTTHTGVMDPGFKVCPLTTRWCSFELAPNSGTKPDEVDPDLGRLLNIKTFPLADQEPEMDEIVGHKTLVGGLNDLTGPWSWNTEAFKVHKLWFTGSQMARSMWFKIKEAEQNTWYRYSLCVGKGNV